MPEPTGRRTAIILVGYHYLSTPVYLALRKQLTAFDLYYVFTKDTIASDTNYKYFDRAAFKNHDERYVELAYDPPWFRGLMAWHVRSKPKKLALWIRWVFAFTRFKRELLRLVKRLDPDLIIMTSDLFFSPRYLARKLPAVPMALIQPCYVDLWTRPQRYGLLKRLVNLVQPALFERQQYFGLEIERAALLLWEPSAYDAYALMGRQATRIVNPSHLDIRDNAALYREQERRAILESFGLHSDAKVLSILPAYYADVKGHGADYQRTLEESLVAAISRLQPAFSIVVKIHPNEDASYWERVLEPVRGRHLTIVHNIDRFRLMAVSDYVVSANSYAAVEATLSGAVAVNFVPGIAIIGEDFCRPFSRNAALTCTSVDALVAALTRADDARTAYRDEIAAAQGRVLGEASGSRKAEDVFLDLVSDRTGARRAEMAP